MRPTIDAMTNHADRRTLAILLALSIFLSVSFFVSSSCIDSSIESLADSSSSSTDKSADGNDGDGSADGISHCDPDQAVCPVQIIPDLAESGFLEDYDQYTINLLSLSSNELEVEVSYGGGCREHLFSLLSDGTVLTSYPAQLYLFLYHESNDDPCEAWLTESRSFDLTPLVQEPDPKNSCDPSSSDGFIRCLLY